MKLLPATTLACLLGAAALPAFAATPTATRDAHGAELAALARAKGSCAEVHIVTSRRSWDAGLRTIGRDPKPRRDSVGNALVLARIRAHQLTDVSEFVHETERRCGGYFAFDTLAEAEAFLRTERAQQAQATSFIAYPIDNQATVGPWLPQVSETKIRDTISWLSTGYPNRYYSSTHGYNAATWIRDTWLGLANGRSDVSAELFTACGNCGGQPSVILTIQGNELPNEIVVLGGHLDSISNSGSGNTMNAPGADDDASGIASLTEVLRVAMASGWKPKRTVKFMGYSAEEVGLRGSAAIASSFRNANRNVVGVLQLDMTNFRTTSSVDMQLITDYSNADLQQFVRNLFDTYLKPLGMSRGTYTCGYGCSDHASWTSYGFPSAMMYEGADWPYLHTTSDTLANMGNTATPSVGLVKLGLAFLGELAKTNGTTPPPPTGTTLSNGVVVSGLSASAGTALVYTMTVPAGASNLKFATAGGTGNADLYVRFGSAPTDSSYDCRPYRLGNLESCSFAAPAAGTWHVRLKARTAFSGVKLTPTFTASGGGGGGGSAQTYANSTAVAIPDGGQVDSTITVSGRSGNAPAATPVAVNITHAKRGDLRLRLIAPDGSSYLLKASNSTDTAANVVTTFSANLSTELLNGTWKLRVIDVATGNTGTLNSWSLTF